MAAYAADYRIFQWVF